MSVSLRRRIAMGTTLTTAVVVAIAALAVWFAARTVLDHALDAAVQAVAQGAASRPPPPSVLGLPPDHGPGPGRPGVPWFLTPQFAAGTGTTFLQYVDHQTGEELYRSASLPPGTALTAAFHDLADGRGIDLRLADGRWIRAMKRRVSYAGLFALPPWVERPAVSEDALPEHTRVIDAIIGVDASDAHGVLTAFAVMLGLLWVVATTLSALTSAWLKRAILRPIDRISATISGIDPGNLKARVPAAEVPEEMRVVLDRLDAMVARLDEAFSRERTTIANIAHELRTPVAGIGATLEFALARGAHASRDEDLRECLGMAQAMQGMIANLLTLARLESGQLRLTPLPVDLAAALQACRGPLAGRLAERRCTVSGRIEPGLAVFAQPEQLGMMLTNVLDNALSHGLADDVIAVAGLRRDGMALIAVDNATDGSLHDVSRIFQPFWRADTARSGGQHCGLGLALVQRFADLFGGSVEARIDERHRFHLLIRLPLAPTDADAG